MPKPFKLQARRVIDANINRAKEGLRVCEDITRFILEDPALTGELKRLRHRLDALAAGLCCRRNLLKERDSQRDSGRKIHPLEIKRRSCPDIFFANIQRAKESLRVLEEFSKLFCTRAAAGLKELRYRAYELEKKAAPKLK